MQPITEEWIHQCFDCFEGTSIEAVSGGWTLKTPCGRKVNIHPYHIDFRGITKLAPGEKEEDREQLLFELMTLAHEPLGVVSLISCHGKEHGDEGANLWFYGKCYSFKMDGPWWRFSSTLAQRYFGDQATRKLILGGYRIDAGQGISATIGFNEKHELMVTKAVGGGNVLEAAMRMVNEVQGYVIAAGTRENILSCLGHGETLGFEVIPELYITSKQQFFVSWLAGTICFPIGILIGASTGNFENGIGIGMGLGMVTACAYNFFFRRNGQKQARERGQALKGNQPTLGRRQANLEDARARGMLL